MKFIIAVIIVTLIDTLVLSQSMMTGLTTLVNSTVPTTPDGQIPFVVAAVSPCALAATLSHGSATAACHDFLQAITGSFTEAALNSLLMSTYVLAAEPDTYLQIAGSASNVKSTQSWGLARLSSRSLLPPGNSYVCSNPTFPKKRAKQVNMYLIDSGVDDTHPDLSGKITNLGNTIDTDPTDANGHGTMMAGLLVGTNTGVYPDGTVKSVKAVSGYGFATLSSLVAALSMVNDDVDTNCVRNRVCGTVSLSLAGLYSPILNNCVDTMSPKVAITAAAGNFGPGYSVQQISPASATTALSVSASDLYDNIAPFACRGAKILGPGVAVPTTYPGNRYAVVSGTSVSTPMAAALGAMFISNQRYKTGADVHADVLSSATNGVINMMSDTDTSNALLYNPF